MEKIEFGGVFNPSHQLKNKIMIYDTAGNIIQEPIQNCDCGLTGGCGKCNPSLKKENINNIQEQDREKLLKKNHKHRFQFSHTARETRGEQAIYMTIYYVICPECGELREQTIIKRLED